MAEERDEKELTGDLAIDDESAGEVTGGRTVSREDAEKTTSRMVKPRREKSRRMFRDR
jgi:hypothetical protein